MTDKTKSTPGHTSKIDFGTFFLGFIVLFALLMILKNSELAIQSVQKGLRLCAVTVIPSLFPFMVISEVLVAVGFGNLLGRLVEKPFCRFFGISAPGASAVLLGATCGFPIGAKTAMALYNRGAISAKECSRLLAFCNIPSSGFVISVVGVSLFVDRRFGIFLYFSALMAALLCGLIFRPKRQKESTFVPRLPHKDTIGISTFTAAVSSATSSMLSVCAYVIFFSAVVGCLSYAISDLSLPPSWGTFLYGLFEISSGVNAAATAENTLLGSCLCGWAVGWSGLSVHFQIVSLCSGRGLSFLPYFLSKSLQGLLCAAAALGYAKFFMSHRLQPAQNTGLFFSTRFPLSFCLFVGLFFFLCIMACYGRSRLRSQTHLR